MHNSAGTEDGADPGREVTAGPRLRILLVDDHPIMRDALAALLNDTGNFEIVGTAGNVDEALKILERADPAVVVLDMSMPGCSGMDLFARLRGRNPTPRVLVLSMHASEDYIVAALNAGALGYVCKDAPSAQLLKGLRAVAAGRMFLHVDGVAHPPTRSLCGEEHYGDSGRAHLTLTARERAVLRSLALGYGIKRTALELGISTKTVEKHRSNLMRKLDLHNAAGLTLFAARQGLVRTWEHTHGDANGDDGRTSEGTRQPQVGTAA